jgi:hypothetical protein
MSRRRLLSLRAATIVALAFVVNTLPGASAQAPTRLDDAAFWKLVTDFSEPDGTFHSENLVSNEIRFQGIVPSLIKAVAPGRAYVGVGSEQNYTYIAAVRPSLAYIVDIRRGNLDLHLTYKALFEMSTDRVDFVSRLFSRAKPAGLTAASTVTEIFAAFDQAAPSAELYATNLAAIYKHLTTTHGFALSSGDKEGIAFVYKAWFTDGPRIRYQLNTGGGRGGGGGFPTYADLMTTTDADGQHRSYLATQASFAFIKDLHSRNLIVPVVGNFGGPKALREVAKDLKQRKMIVSTFYASNVEQYLERDGLWNTFCASVATMPLDATSTLVRSARGGFSGVRGGGATGGGFSLELVPLAAEVKSCPTK